MYGLYTSQNLATVSQTSEAIAEAWVGLEMAWAKAMYNEWGRLVATSLAAWLLHATCANGTGGADICKTGHLLCSCEFSSSHTLQYDWKWHVWLG